MPHRVDDSDQPAGFAGGFGFGRAIRWTPWVPAFRGSLAAALVSTALLAAGGPAAQAGVRVEGSPEAIRIDVADASVADVLNALRAQFNLRYRSNDALDTRTSGNFRGPLRRVVARMLDGYDFAMTVTPEGIDVLILRQNAAANIAVAPAAARPAPAPVMTAAEANRYERERSR
jgi:hypothetical protein